MIDFLARPGNSPFCGAPSILREYQKTMLLPRRAWSFHCSVVFPQPISYFRRNCSSPRPDCMNLLLFPLETVRKQRGVPHMSMGIVAFRGDVRGPWSIRLEAPTLILPMLQVRVGSLGRDKPGNILSVFAMRLATHLNVANVHCSVPDLF